MNGASFARLSRSEISPRVIAMAQADAISR